MTKVAEAITVICGSCDARYKLQASLLDPAIQFECSCGANLKADTDDLFQIRYDMMNKLEITLQPVG